MFKAEKIPLCKLRAASIVVPPAGAFLPLIYLGFLYSFTYFTFLFTSDMRPQRLLLTAAMVVDLLRVVAVLLVCTAQTMAEKEMADKYPEHINGIDPLSEEALMADFDETKATPGLDVVFNEAFAKIDANDDRRINLKEVYDAILETEVSRLEAKTGLPNTGLRQTVQNSLREMLVHMTQAIGKQSPPNDDALEASYDECAKHKHMFVSLTSDWLDDMAGHGEEL
jgi:hypothetical protein